MFISAMVNFEEIVMIDCILFISDFFRVDSKPKKNSVDEQATDR